MFRWSEQSIEYLKTASEYGEFPRVLAARAAKYFSKTDTVLDAGCGIGYLTLALAQYAAHVTGADISEQALSVLEENRRAQNVKTVSVYRGDVFSLPDEMQFDSMVFCFCGGTLETLRAVKAHCRGKAVLFKKNWSTHRFTLRNVAIGPYNYRSAVTDLRTLDIPFQTEVFSVDMGQPFRSLPDAVRFFQLHSRSTVPESIDISAVRSRITQTGRTDFPYYLPADRPVGLIVLHAIDIPDSIMDTETNKKLEDRNK